MRIDSHVHMPSRHGIWGIPYFSGSEYLDFMDQNGIDKSFILPLDGLFLDPHEENLALSKWCEADRNRLIPFFTFEPRSNKAKDEIRRCTQEFGMKGVKLHTWLQGFRPTEDCLIPLAEELAELEIPILFHDGTPPYSTPLQIAELARMIPELKVVLGHGGLYDFDDEAIIAVKEHSNVYISMTSLPTFYMMKLVSSLPMNRLMFGSDGGLNSMEKHGYVSLRWSLFDNLEITEGTRETIIHKTPAELVKI